MKTILKKLETIKKKKILVIGDLMIDQFIYGNVSRISPEAPVPVVEVSREKTEPGGAGNVANNIVSLEASCGIVCLTGTDPDGDLLRKELSEKGIDIRGVFSDSTRPTIRKTRIIAGHQQVVRVDREEKAKIPGQIMSRVIKHISSEISKVDGVIISDYGKGLICPELLEKVIDLCNRNNKVITVDPKIEHFKRYKKVTCLTPNALEAAAGMGLTSIDSEQSMVDTGFRILKMLDSESLLITRGEKGMSLFLPGKKYLHIPTMAQEVFDVSGAGDTVIATFTLSLIAGFSFAEAAKISNYAAGIVVGKLGTTPVFYPELHRRLSGLKAL